jgi:CubicO group peptidase (beta-lactamase class C family)
MKSTLLTIILLSGFFYTTAYAQGVNKPKLDSFFNILSEKNRAMGSVAISKNGTVLYSKAVGYSSVSGSGKTPATNATRYRIGSITKMFTATMIFQLIEEGKIKLTTTLDQFFPTVPNASKITIGNLLNHRSGIHNFTSDPAYTSYMTQAKTQAEMLAIIAKSKPDFEPGEKAAYSNSNYVLLGFIIEKLTNQSYAKNLSQRITSKSGLSSTYVGGKINASNNESFSYRLANEWLPEPETEMSIPGGAGAIVSTPTDLTRFAEALFAGKLISQTSLAQMKTIVEGYGMGMFQIPFYTKTAYGHNGGIDGFASNLAYFPDDSVAVAYCTNGQVYPMNDVLIGILSIYFNKEYSIPTFNTAPLKTADLDKYIGVYSSTQIPLKITVTKDNTTLMAQATGQSSFPLEATGKDVFRFDQAGITMEFNLAKNEFTLKQGGGSFLFTKDK